MAQNQRYLKSIEPSDYKVLTAGPIEAGDILQWDATALVAKRQATGSAVNCIGASEDTIPLPSRIDKTDVVDLARVVGGDGKGVFRFKTTAAEVYKHGLWVEVGADSQTVKLTVVDANKVGKIWLPEGETITGAAGVEVVVNLLPQYVGNNL